MARKYGLSAVKNNLLVGGNWNQDSFECTVENSKYHAVQKGWIWDSRAFFYIMIKCSIENSNGGHHLWFPIAEVYEDDCSIATGNGYTWGDEKDTDD